MKRFFPALFLALTLSLLTAGFTLGTSAALEPELRIPYGKATVDGKVSEGEYTATYLMNAETASSWWTDDGVGDFSAQLYFSWDENGLYYAAVVHDTTPCFHVGDGPWVGWDCVELAVNPGNKLAQTGDTQGVFLTFGATSDGKVVAYRHNYKDGAISSAITGVSNGHKTGSSDYTVEVYIPWDVMLASDYKWTPKAGSEFSLLPCAINSRGEGGNDNIVTTMKFNGSDFRTAYFLPAVLLAKETVTETPATVPETEDPATEAPTTAPSTAPSVTETVTTGTSIGCGSVLPLGAGVAGMALLAAGVWFTRKNKDKD